jgi:hypothetical protein
MKKYLNHNKKTYLILCKMKNKKITYLSKKILMINMMTKRCIKLIILYKLIIIWIFNIKIIRTIQQQSTYIMNRWMMIKKIKLTTKNKNKYKINI